MLHFRSRFPWSDLNPEFLREGSAVKDFMQPSLVVVGSHDPLAAQRVASLYASLPVEISVVRSESGIPARRKRSQGFHAAIPRGRRQSRSFGRTKSRVSLCFTSGRDFRGPI